MATAAGKLLRVLAAITALSGFLTTCALAATAATEGVKKLVSEFAATWNRHDMEAFGVLFAPDADFVNVTGLKWVGRRTIQAQHAYTHGTIPADSVGFAAEDRPYYGIFKNSTLQFDQIDVRLLRQDVAVARVNWELRGDARAQESRRGLFLFVLTRQTDGWSIAAAQNTEIKRVVK